MTLEHKFQQHYMHTSRIESMLSKDMIMLAEDFRKKLFNSRSATNIQEGENKDDSCSVCCQTKTRLIALIDADICYYHCSNNELLENKLISKKFAR